MPPVAPNASSVLRGFTYADPTTPRPACTPRRPRDPRARRLPQAVTEKSSVTAEGCRYAPGAVHFRCAEISTERKGCVCKRCAFRCARNLIERKGCRRRRRAFKGVGNPVERKGCWPCALPGFLFGFGRWPFWLPSFFAFLVLNAPGAVLSYTQGNK